ncbi:MULTISPECIES: winged helix-turn-helix domain-containing protein [Stenotrophomonas]|uniref:winged helix-turn-helix domain-containing protein n=1 Tax=Stenotrophomonas TaxID=40323 RepID=UPI000AE9B4A3|nr:MULTISPECIES: helix-turn-helix domain-containing protein [Stenotrophomonas]
MNDWIRVIILKNSDPRASAAVSDGTDSDRIETINAVMHRRTAERLSNPLIASSWRLKESGEGAQDETAAVHCRLLSRLGGLSGGNCPDTDADGKQWIVTLTHSRKAHCGSTEHVASLIKRLNFGSFSYQSRPPQVISGGKRAKLTPSEAALLELLLARAGQVVSRSEMLSLVAPLQSDLRAVDRVICRLRRKLNAVDEENANILHTELGQGYILLVGDAQGI